jgi:hypothetical protein
VSGAIGGVSFGDEPIPLLREKPEVRVDVGLELPNRLGREGVADDFALTSVLDAVAGVEDAALDGDEGVVELSVGSVRRVIRRRAYSPILSCMQTHWMLWNLA